MSKQSNTDLSIKSPRQILNGYGTTDEEIAASGMTPSHLLKVMIFSNDNQIIVSLRPTNSEAARRLENSEQPHKGKQFANKGKSSNVKPLAALITYLPYFSKSYTGSDNVGQDEINKLQQKNDSDLTNATMRFYELVLNQIVSAESVNSTNLKGGKAPYSRSGSFVNFLFTSLSKQNIVLENKTIESLIKDFNKKNNSLSPEGFEKFFIEQVVKPFIKQNDSSFEGCAVSDNNIQQTLLDFALEKSGENKKTFVQELDDASLAIKSDYQDKFGDQYYDVYFSKGEDGIPIFENADKLKPLLFIKIPHQDNTNLFDLYQYDYASSTYVQVLELQSDKLKKLEVIAYRGFKMNGKQVEKIKYITTADYDQFVTGAKREFSPNNSKFIELKNEFQRLQDAGHITDKRKIGNLDKLLEEFYKNGTASKKELNLLATNIALLEVGRRKELLASEQYYKYGGIMDTLQQVHQVVLGSDLNKAINHGQETSNPHPEPISNDPHPFILPGFKLVMVQSEQGLCEYINKQREGFDLPVNVKWGWDADDQGKLFIPENRFNFEEVENAISKLSDPEKQDQQKIFDTYLGLMRLKTSPTIKYPILEDEPEYSRDIKEETAAKCQKLHQEELKKLEEGYEKLNTEFFKKYKKGSLVQKGDSVLKKQSEVFFQKTPFKKPPGTTIPRFPFMGDSMKSFKESLRNLVSVRD